MKKLLLPAVLILLVAAPACMPAYKCKSAATVKPPRNEKGDILYSKVIDIPGKSADDLYVMCLMWFNVNYKSAKAVIQVADPTHKLIIGQGYWVHYLEFSNNSTNAGPVHNTVQSADLTHNITIQCRDGKIKCDIQKLYYELDPAVARTYYVSSRQNVSRMVENEGLTNCVLEKIDLEANRTFKEITEYISKPNQW